MSGLSSPATLSQLVKGASDYERNEPGTALSILPRYERGQFAKQLGRGAKIYP